jgi:hypothetical protein
MKKSKKHSIATSTGNQNTGLSRFEKSKSSSPSQGLFGCGYTITEDVLM